MKYKAGEILIIIALTASYAITFLPGGMFLLPSICSCIVSSVIIYRALFPIITTRENAL